MTLTRGLPAPTDDFDPKAPRSSAPGLDASYVVQCADPDSHGQAVRLLIERRYAWRGLHPGETRAHPLQPDSLTLVASRSEEVFGTVTLSLDGEHGLLAEALYRDEIAFLRQREARMCEITKLAVDASHNTKKVLGALFHLIYIHARLLQRCTDAVIEVHPRHAGFYRRMLGFTTLGAQKNCLRVNGAPAVLLHLELSHMDEQIARLGGSGCYRARSLYAYFLSRKEQDQILHKLCATH